jgi:hypothetical protein
MESEKEFKEELKEVLPIYKIAGIVIGVLLLVGIIFALITEFRPHKTAPAAPKVEPTPVSNMTEPNSTQNFTENVTTNITNATVQNITQHITNATQNVSNVTIIATPTPQPTLALANYSWSTIIINFPDKLKKVPSNSTSFHYIEILEGDGTPITNGEQFNIKFTLDDHYGRTSEIKQNYENGKWLFQLRLPNPGTYTLGVTVACADKNGHCKRFYTAGGTEKTLDVEVI